MPEQNQPHEAPVPALSAQNLAEYNLALGNFLAFPKRLVQTFTDVVLQIFPLTANLSVLQQFCDTYLNFTGDDEPSPVRFTPSAPIVMLEVVDYGSIASNTPGAGWFAQHELAFGVALDWQVMEQGQWRTKGAAYIYPYIYVDDPLSVAGGRQIYGWSKAPVILESIPPIFQPTGQRCLLNVALAGLGKVRGERNAGKDFFSVWQDRYTPSMRSAIPDMLTFVPRAVTASINAAFDLIGAGASSIPRGDNDSLITALRSVVSRLYGNLDRFMQSSPRGANGGSDQAAPAGQQSVSIITLKQVRDVPDSANSCYQGVIESPMRILRVKDGGLLVNPSIPNLSGGLSIRIADIQEQPVVKYLGIDGLRAQGPHGAPEFRINPLFPFWIKMDMTYGLADFQAWRTNLTGWTTNNTPQFRAGDPQRINYVELGSGADQEVPGPLTFPKVTMRFFPLRAKRAPLSDLVANYLDNTLYRFELNGEIQGGEAVVIAILSNFKGMRTQTRNETYSDAEFTLAIPVKWHSNDDPAAVHQSLVPAFSFVGKEWNTDTSIEAYGRLAMTSEFFDKGSWPHQIPHTAKEPIVSIKSELFAEPLATEEARLHTLFEFVSERTDPSGDSLDSYMRALGLPNFTGQCELSSVALKQVRDASDPQKADYQSLVAMDRQFRADPQESTAFLASKHQKVTIKANEFPTMKIIQLLGLDGYANTTQESGYIRYDLEPVDAFFVCGSLLDERTKNLAVRIGNNNPWRRV